MSLVNKLMKRWTQQGSGMCSAVIRKDLSVRTLDKKRHDTVHDRRMTHTHTRSYCLTWIRIFPRETKGVLSSVRNKQPMKKSPWSFLKNCEEHTHRVRKQTHGCRKHKQQHSWHSRTTSGTVSKASDKGKYQGFDRCFSGSMVPLVDMSCRFLHWNVIGGNLFLAWITASLYQFHIVLCMLSYRVLCSVYCGPDLEILSSVMNQQQQPRQYL